MDDLSQAVILMLVGSILGSVITPSTEILFKSRFMKSRTNNNFADGLILLCSANGLWIICTLLMVIAESEDKHRNGMGMMLLLIFATLFYIWSFSKFKKASQVSGHREIGILCGFSARKFVLGTAGFIGCRCKLDGFRYLHHRQVLISGDFRLHLFCGPASEAPFPPAGI